MPTRQKNIGFEGDATSWLNVYSLILKKITKRILPGL